MCSIGIIKDSPNEDSCYYAAMYMIFVIIPLILLLCVNMFFFKEKYLKYRFSLIIVALNIIQFLFIWFLRVYLG